MKSFLKVLFIHPGIDEKSATSTLERGTSIIPPHCSFTVVSNCFLALERMETTHFDLIFLQKDLKFFPSLTFTDIMKDLNIKIPVILLLRKNSGFVSGESSLENILSYPFSFSDFRKAIIKVMPQILEPCINMINFKSEDKSKVEIKKDQPVAVESFLKRNRSSHRASSRVPGNNRNRERFVDDFQLNDLASFESLVDLPKDDEIILIKSETADYFYQQHLEVLDEDFRGDDSISDQSGFMNEDDDSFDLMSLDDGSNNEGAEDLSEWRATLFRNIDDVALRSSFEKLYYK
jgi:hypothetical protein